MRRTYKQWTALSGAVAVACLGASAGTAAAASSSPFTCDAPDGVVMRMSILPDKPASVPVPYDCFGDGAVRLDVPASGRSGDAGSVAPLRGVVVQYTPAAGARGVVTLRFTSGGREAKVAVDVGGAGARPDVVAIGDSVTAGFGYCGADDACGPLDAAVKNSWMSLSDCNQEAEYPKLPANLCSNNRRGGLPWVDGGDTSGSIAYPFQFGAYLREAGEMARLPGAPTVRNWAVSGARPAHWDYEPILNDPTNQRGGRGGFSEQTTRIRDSLVVMTLGANKLLADFLQFDFAYPMAWLADTTGPYAKCTGARGWFWGYDEAGRDRLRDCFEEDWTVNKQSWHLVNIYKRLLSQGNRVMVLGYHLACPTTFGTWQQQSFWDGPAGGRPCVAQRGDNGMSQWDQAVYVSGLLNERIRAAVEEARGWARTSLPGRETQIAYVDTAWLNRWQDHQAWSREPWVFPNDTGIHPSRRGHAMMAENVGHAACRQLGVFCTEHAALSPGTFRSASKIGSAARAEGVVAGANVTAHAAAVSDATVVARVGATEITAGQVRRMGRALGDDARDPSSATADEALKTLITGAQVRAEARRLGIAWPRERALDRATRRFADGDVPSGVAAEHRYGAASAILGQRVATRLVGAPRFPTAAEGRAFARRHWHGADHDRVTTAAAREQLYDDRVEVKRERAQARVDRRYRRVTRCTRAAAGNPACSTQHGAWPW